MKSAKFIIPIVLITLGIWIGCQKFDENSVIPKQSSVKIDKTNGYHTLVATNVSDHYVFMYPDGILVFLNPEEGYYKNLITLIPENEADVQNLYEILSQKKINLEYRKNYLRIQTPDQIVYFVVNNSEGQKFINELQQKTTANIITGIQLGLCQHQYYLNKLHLNQFNSIEAFFFGNTKKQPKCDSGGEGATSCSIGDTFSDCSVSCGEGYYACCDSDGNRCYCVKDN